MPTNPLGPDQRWVQVRLLGADTAITLVTWFGSMLSGSIKETVIESDDLDGDVARLRARGLVIEGQVQEAPWGRFVTFDDPDGNGLVLEETAVPMVPDGG